MGELLFFSLSQIKRERDAEEKKIKREKYLYILTGKGYTILGKMSKLGIKLQSLNKCQVESQKNEEKRAHRN